MDVAADGSLTVNATTVTNGQPLTSETITVDGGAAALLKATKIEVKGGTNGQVLTTDASGKAVWLDTTNNLVLVGDKLTSTVNGKSSSVDLTGKVGTSMLADDAVTKGKINADVAGNGIGQNVDGSLEVNAGNGIAIEGDKVTVNAGTGLNFGTDGKLNVDVATVDKAGIVKPGAGLDVAADGTITVNATTVTNGQALTSQSIIVSGEGATALLGATSIEIKGGLDGDILTTDAAGNAVWIKRDSIVDIANDTTVGTVKPGAGLNVDAEGTLTVDGGNGIAIEGDKVTVNAGTGLNFGTDGKLNVDIATKDKAGIVKPGAGLDVAADGTITVNATTVTNGQALTSNTITVSGEGATALLGATSIEIKGSTIDGQVLTSDALGNVSWTSPADTTNDLGLTGNTLTSTVNGKSSSVDLTGKVDTPMLADDAVTKGKINADVAGNGIGQNVDGSLEVNAGNGIVIDGDKVTVNAGTGLSFGTDGKLNVDVATADKAGIVKPGAGLDVAADGTITVNATTVTNGQALTSETIAVTGGAESLLKATKIEIIAGTDGQVLTTDALGKAVWKTPEETTNTLELAGNTLTSTVNGKSSTVNLIDAITKGAINEDVAGNGIGQNVDGSLEVNAGNGIAIVGDAVTVNAGTGLSFGTDGKLNVDVATADKAGIVKPGAGLDVAADGTITVNATTVTNGQALTSKTINVSAAGNNALLAATELEIKAGVGGQVLTTNDNGDVVWSTPLEKGGVVSNILTLDGDVLKSDVNGVYDTLSLTGKIGTSMLADDAVTADKINADVAGNGLVQNVTTGALEVNAGNGITIVDDKVTVNAGTGLSFGTDGKLNVDVATADKAGTVKPGAGLNVAEDGTLTVNNGEGLKLGTDGKLVVDSKTLTTDGVIVIGDTNATSLDKAVLVDTKLSVKGGSITTGHIANGTIKAEDIEKPTTPNGGKDLMLGTDANGTPAWIKASMPKFFYMPSIVMPTHADQIDAILTPNTSVDASGVYTVKLYDNYVTQFGTPAVSSEAGYKLPVLGNTELIYNVVWFDTNVFTDVKVSNTGVMTYKVAPNADVTIGSFMNIVFAVK